MVGALLLSACQKNYYLIEEAYYQGDYLKTVTLINQMSLQFPKQIRHFFDHSEERLANKLVDSAAIYQRTSDFHMLCYIHKLLPELRHLNTRTSSKHFKTAYDQLYQRYTLLLPSFLKNELQLGNAAFETEHYFLAIARFKRYLLFEENETTRKLLLKATQKASLSLQISPFSIPENDAKILFGIQIAPDLLQQLTTQIKGSPIPFISLSMGNSNNQQTYTLSGKIIASYKDTQLLPESVTITDTLRYQHNVGGIPQWDTYEFQYTVKKIEFTVTLKGEFTLTDPRGHTQSFTVYTRYGEDSKYRNETLTLPLNYYKIEFPPGYAKILNVPLLLDESEITHQTLTMFSNDLYQHLTTRFNEITSTSLISSCPY